jgi:hypothetical protein
MVGSSDEGPAAIPAEQALAQLIRELETDDYRSFTGVSARQTAAFVEAKALLTLRNALDSPPWWAPQPASRD